MVETAGRKVFLFPNRVRRNMCGVLLREDRPYIYLYICVKQFSLWSNASAVLCGSCLIKCIDTEHTNLNNPN